MNSGIDRMDVVDHVREFLIFTDTRISSLRWQLPNMPQDTRTYSNSLDSYNTFEALLRRDIQAIS